MLTEYIQAVLRRAQYEIIEDDNPYYGEIPGFDGVYASTKTLESCREEPREVLEKWIPLRVSHNLGLPVVDGVRLKIEHVA